MLGVGCAGRCGGERASGAGPLSKEEARAIPGVVVFLSERAGQKDVWTVSPDGTETQVTRGPEDDYPGPVSPDGKSLLVVAVREEQGLLFQQLRVQPLSGGDALPLHAPRARSRNASWAPDGSWLVAESDAQGFSDLVRLEPKAGGAEVRLTQVPQGCFEPAVSPDGQSLAYVCSREGDPEVYVAKADGSQERRITTFHKEDRSPQWSPDGTWLLFVSDREGPDRLFLVRPDGSDVRGVSAHAFAGEEREGTFSPDGQRLAYVSRSEDGRSRIWSVPVEGGSPVALTDGSHRDDMPAWSPDGKYLAFVSEREDDVDLYLMRADGSGQTRLTTAKAPDWLPRWVARR
ncbi:tolB protein precursor protein [Myxococcus sp. K15C18031901]|uniref:TolB family protein n=1 Tax=Myxococcus dinghuensis TaxID=2906761 RepID=UPI0020A83410|nr:tolB protein precursor protein [Myxococcus dinghuensis]MCP3099052.1 tolB protein precursor protein [Myxococcus dinghuensis]